MSAHIIAINPILCPFLKIPLILISVCKIRNLTLHFQYLKSEVLDVVVSSARHT